MISVCFNKILLLNITLLFLGSQKCAYTKNLMIMWIRSLNSKNRYTKAQKRCPSAGLSALHVSSTETYLVSVGNFSYMAQNIFRYQTTPTFFKKCGCVVFYVSLEIPFLKNMISCDQISDKIKVNWQDGLVRCCVTVVEGRKSCLTLGNKMRHC